MNNFLKAFARPWLYKGLYFFKVNLAIFCISKEDLIVKFNYVNFQHKKKFCVFKLKMNIMCDIIHAIAKFI